jgi:hypothetical protein
MGGLTLDGDLASTWKKGVLEADGDFRFNGGPLEGQVVAGFAPDSKASTLRAELRASCVGRSRAVGLAREPDLRCDPEIPARRCRA